MAGKYVVKLTEEEQKRLQKLVTSGKTAARTLSRARILLKSAGGDKDGAIARALDVGLTTISTECARGALRKEWRLPSPIVAPEGIISAS